MATELEGQMMPWPEETEEEQLLRTQHLLKLLDEAVQQKDPAHYWKAMYTEERRKHYHLHHAGKDPESDETLHPYQIGCVTDKEE
jgi:hypothetical protein